MNFFYMMLKILLFFFEFSPCQITNVTKVVFFLLYFVVSTSKNFKCIYNYTKQYIHKNDVNDYKT